MKKLLIAAAVAGIFVAPQAFAEDSKAFEGFSVQVGTGYQDSNLEYKDIIVSGSTATKASGSSVALNLGAAYTASVANDFTIGVVLEYNAVDGKPGNANFTLNGAPDGSSSSKLTNQYSISLVPGYAFDKTTLAYAKVGYANAKVKSLFDGGDSDTFNIHGFVLGLGVKKLISDKMFAFGEVNYTGYKDKSFPDGNVNVSSYSGNVGLGYKF